jgi:hypothetical protein
MKNLTKNSLIVVLSFFLLNACEPSAVSENSEKFSENDLETLKLSERSPYSTMLKSTGGVWAFWEGCPDGHESNNTEDSECPGGDDEHEEGECEGEEGHEDGDCRRARPARDFRLEYNAQLKSGEPKGRVSFEGVNDFLGIGFNGKVTWVEEGRASNELFFGGKVTGGTVTQKCFLFSIQDNGQGMNANADRMQYRLFGQSHQACNDPDHLPIGYPIAVYRGNLQVH